MINKNLNKIITFLNNNKELRATIAVLLMFIFVVIIATILKPKETITPTETILIQNIQSLNDDTVLLEKAKKEIERRIDRSKSLSACYKQQLDRKINKEEYSIEYCSDDNLKQFSGLN
jgi:hypothetical protein